MGKSLRDLPGLAGTLARLSNGKPFKRAMLVRNNFLIGSCECELAMLTPALVHSTVAVSSGNEKGKTERFVLR